MKHLFLLWLSIFLGPLVMAAEINPHQFDEQRPADGIYDPGDWIQGPAKSNLMRELSSIKESSGIDVLVAVVDKIGDADPQALAEQLAERWGYHGGRALILCIPDQKESPWIAIGGQIRSEIPRTTLDAIILKAKERARAEDTVHGAARRAVDSLGEDLRYSVARALRGVKSTGPVAPPSLKDFFFLFIRSFQKILIILGIILVVFALLIYGLYRIWKKVRGTLTPKTFPEISWKPRFGAPYGGISYTHSLKKKVPRTHDP
jgi:uncharacterized membrane protein YgcG